MRLDHPAEHHADDRCGDCGQRAGQAFIAAKLFDERRGPKAQPGEQGIADRATAFDRDQKRRLQRRQDVHHAPKP
jgi:hypothetical protein